MKINHESIVVKPVHKLTKAEKVEVLADIAPVNP